MGSTDTGRPVQYLSSTRGSKEEMASGILRDHPTEPGVVCALYVVEPCRASPTFGFMNARIQTWFRFNVQICLNGREWLGRRRRAGGDHPRGWDAPHRRRGRTGHQGGPRPGEGVGERLSLVEARHRRLPPGWELGRLGRSRRRWRLDLHHRDGDQPLPRGGGPPGLPDPDPPQPRQLRGPRRGPPRRRRRNREPGDPHRPGDQLRHPSRRRHPNPADVGGPLRLPRGPRPGRRHAGRVRARVAGHPRGPAPGAGASMRREGSAASC